MSYKKLGIAFLATLTLTAITTTTASAEPTLPNILPLGTAALPLTGVTTTGYSKLGISAFSFISVSGKGTFTGNATKLGSYKELYDGWSGALGEKCSGMGDTAGTVEQTGTFHIRDYKSGTTLKTAFIWLLKELTIDCEGGFTIRVKGCVAGALSPESTLTKMLTLTLKEGAAKLDEEIITVLNEANTANELCELLSSSDGGAFELSSLTQTTTLSAFKQNSKETEVLVMPL